MISIDKSIRTSRVDTGSANRLESDRFLNSCNATCPVWNSEDTTGRKVCEDSFYTKSPGCNSAVERVDVENYQRPQYFDYVNLDAYGLNGNLYTQANKTRSRALNDVYNLTGNFGQQHGSRLNIHESINKYEKGMAANKRFKDEYGSGGLSQSHRNRLNDINQKYR